MLMLSPHLRCEFDGGYSSLSPQRILWDPQLLHTVASRYTWAAGGRTRTICPGTGAVI